MFMKTIRNFVAKKISIKFKASAGKFISLKKQRIDDFNACKKNAHCWVRLG